MTFDLQCPVTIKIVSHFGKCCILLKHESEMNKALFSIQFLVICLLIDLKLVKLFNFIVKGNNVLRK